MYKWNPRRLTGSFKGTVKGRDFAVQLVNGLMDGDGVTAEFDEDAVTSHVGLDGQVTLILNANAKAKVTVNVSQGSPVNNELTALVGDSRRDYIPVGALTFEDLNGTTVVKGPQSWITRQAKVSWAKGVQVRPWIFEIAEAEFFIGGAELVP